MDIFADICSEPCCAVLELQAAVLPCWNDDLDLGSCLQSRFLSGHTGVQRVVSGGILASENHPWTEASAILLKEALTLRGKEGCTERRLSRQARATAPPLEAHFSLLVSTHAFAAPPRYIY